jgi:hypothetical protein
MPTNTFVPNTFVPNTFIHFGCWNQGLCGNESVPLTTVMQTLQTFAQQEHPDFIVVAGDNYYPGKEKNKVTGEKVKTIVPGDLAAGFACLPKGVPIDMLLGNHDLETNIYLSGFTDKKETDCFITKAEIKEAIPNHIDLVVQKARSNGETLVLLIDTSMYDDEAIAEMLPCYKKMAGYAEIASKEDLRTEQLRFIQDAITAFQGTNIIFIGHHPITGYKLKKDKIKLIQAFPSFLAMLKNVYQPEKKYYYLCADLHLYQEGTVLLPVDGAKMEIQQYIVGTGGTELDPDPRAGFSPEKEFESTAGVVAGSYTMTPTQERNSAKEFGFLVCDFHDSKKLTFKFITVPMGGGKRSGCKRSSKKKKQSNKNKRSKNKRSKKHNKRI